MKSEQQRTQQLYNALMNSSETESKFESIIDECSRMQKKFKDPEFYPQTNLKEEDESILKDHQWRRIEDQYPCNLFENVSPESIQQGSLGDCYFIISLIYISSHIELVKSLFHPKSSLKYGCVLVYLYYLGQKIPIIIDTQIAYVNSSLKFPLFSHPRNSNDSCWFCLVEKAYAKVCGSYSSIISGNSGFGTHILTGFYSTFFTKIVDIIPSKSLEEEEEIRSSSNANGRIFQIIKELIQKKAMIGTSINKDEAENFDESIGLISNHAYSIVDARESENKLFVKLRNPWGKGAYNGGYSVNSDKWTEQLKKDLDYSDKDDGYFWMLLENYFYYFNEIGYSLPNEKNWKEECVYGKIDGYLDGRTPFSGSKSVGCLPQWSIKFSEKTIVRLSYEIAGPESFHGIYLCKNNGNKINKLYVSTEMMRSLTSSMVNGIEYIVDDFNEPFTFFLTREEARDEPCYFRILIQSPDNNFKIKKFNDNFIKEKWYSFTDTRIFVSDQLDYWDPFQSLPLSTCRQWFIRFPDLLKSKDSEIRFRIFKNINEGPLHLLFARTSDKIRDPIYNKDIQEFQIISMSDYEEFSIPISFKNFYRFNDIFEYRDNDAADYVFTFYRTKESNIKEFKFSVLCENNFEIGVMPEPDPIRNCGYTINNILNDFEKKFSITNNMEFIDQWCLVFKKEPTNLFIEFINNNNQSSEYQIILKETPNSDHAIRINDEAIKFEYSLHENCTHDLIMFKIESIFNPYILSIKNGNGNEQNDFTLNIFGSNDFEMYRITKNGYGIGVQKFDNSSYLKLDNEKIDFPEITFVDQPIDFSPIKRIESKNNSSNVTNNFPDENSYYYDYSYDYSDKSEDENEKAYLPQILNTNVRYIIYHNENNIQETNTELTNNYDSPNSYYDEYEEEEAKINSDKANEGQTVDTPSKKTENVNKHASQSNKNNPNDNNNQNSNNTQNNNDNNHILKFNGEQEHESKPLINKTINESNEKNEKEKKILDEAKIYLFKKDIHYFNLFLVSFFGQKQILALVGFGILILKTRMFSKKMTKKQKIYFTDITKISLLSNNTIEIQINQKSKTKQLLFQLEDSDTFCDQIMKHIYATLNQFEISKISFNNISLPDTLPESTSSSIYFRLNSKKSLKKINIHNEYLKIFSNTLFSHSNTFFLAKVKKMKKLFPFLFPCISLDRNINQIDIVDPKYIFPFILKYTECFENIEHLKIKGSNSNDLQEFLNKIKNINSISFHDNQIKKTDFISSLIIKYKIESIGFDSSLNEKTFKSLIQIDSFNRLKYFRVSNLQKFDFSSCVNYFKQLVVISLTFCNLDINNVLKALESNQINNLQQLDLSGNISESHNNLKYSISSKLNNLHVNNVRWEVNSLKYFIDTCSNSNLISLSINNIEFIDSIKSKDYWKFLLSNLPDQMNTICSLSWNSNEINHEFITFLINSKNLSEVSFCSCNCSNLNEIQRFLIQSVSIKKANIQKICDFNVALFKEFLASIPNMKSLEQIDLSHNSFDIKCFDILYESLINSNLKSIAFDDTNISSYLDLLDLYKKLKVNKRMPIEISYPFCDIIRLNIKHNEIIILNKNLIKLKKPISIRKTYEADPFEEVFYLQNNHSFIQFLSKDKNNEIIQNKDELSVVQSHSHQSQSIDKNIYDESLNTQIKENVIFNDIVDNNNKQSQDNQISEYSYTYYTESEISEIDQTQSQIDVNNTNNKSDIDINASKNLNSHLNDQKIAGISRKDNKNNLYNQKSTNFLYQNPYYHYVNKISNLRVNRDFNNDSFDSGSYKNYTRQNESNIFQHDKKNHLFLMTLSDSYTNSSDQNFN